MHRYRPITYQFILAFVVLALALLSLAGTGIAQELKGYGKNSSGFASSNEGTGNNSATVVPMIQGSNWVRTERNTDHSIQPGGWAKVYGLDITSDVEAGAVLAEFCFRARSTDPQVGPVKIAVGIYVQGVWKGWRTVAIKTQDVGCFSWTAAVTAGSASGTVWTYCLDCSTAWGNMDYMSFTAWQ